MRPNVHVTRRGSVNISYGTPSPQREYRAVPRRATPPPSLGSEEDVAQHIAKTVRGCSAARGGAPAAASLTHFRRTRPPPISPPSGSRCALLRRSTAAIALRATRSPTSPRPAPRLRRLRTRSAESRKRWASSTQSSGFRRRWASRKTRARAALHFRRPRRHAPTAAEARRPNTSLPSTLKSAGATAYGRISVLSSRCRR